MRHLLLCIDRHHLCQRLRPVARGCRYCETERAEFQHGGEQKRPQASPGQEASAEYFAGGTQIVSVFRVHIGERSNSNRPDDVIERG